MPSGLRALTRMRSVPVSSRPMTTRTAALAVLALAAVACTRSATLPAPADAAGDAPGLSDAGARSAGVFVPTDGSRLKARWMEGPDGSRTLWGWYDTTLKAPCRFSRAIDGEQRCLPEGPGADALWFAD